MLSRFLVLLALFTTVMFVGNMHFQEDDVRLTGLNARTLIAAMQVGIVSAVVLTHSVFVFFIKVVKNERTVFVLVSRPNNSAPVSRAESPCNRFAIQEIDSETVAAETASRTSKDTAHEVTNPAVDNFTENEEARCEFQSQSETSEMLSLPLQVVFERSINLDLYFLYVTFVGLVLWCTFVSFNFSTYDSSFIMTSGMVIGWVCNMLSRECRFHESRIERVQGGKTRVLFYSCMSLLIVALGTTQWREPEDIQNSNALNLYIPSFCSGLFWTGVSHEVAFTGVQNVSRGILYDTRRSLPTFLLLVTVSALCCSSETCERVFVYMSGLSRLAAVHLLLVEPVLIFLSLYVMIIALEKQRCTDFGIVLSIVEAMYIVYHCDQYDAAIITTIVASVLLFAAHAAHLLRGT